MVNLDLEKLFNDETSMCKTLARDNNGQCSWGKCVDCGVVLLLHKICKGQLIEDAEKIQSIKQDLTRE